MNSQESFLSHLENTEIEPVNGINSANQYVIQWIGIFETWGIALTGIKKLFEFIKISILTIIITTAMSFNALAADAPDSITQKVNVNGTETDVTVEKASDKELRVIRPSNYRKLMLQRAASKVAGPFISLGKFAGVKLPAESVPFYAAMFLHQLASCNYEENPACLSQFWDSLKDPIGHLGFAAFIAVSENTGKFLQRAMLATENLRAGYTAVGQKGLGPQVRNRARVRARLLGGTQAALGGLMHMLPMSFGMLASSLVEEIAHDRDLINCANSLFKDKGYKKSEEIKAAIDVVCDKAYDHWVSGRKVWSYAPMLVGMMAAQLSSHFIMSQLGRAIKGTAAIGQKVAQKVVNDRIRGIVVNAVVAVLPGGAVRLAVGLGVKVANLFLFFFLNEEVYHHIITRPWNKRQKGRNLISDLDDIHRKMDKVRRAEGDYSKLYSKPRLCNAELRERLQKQIDDDPLSYGIEIRHPGKKCDSGELKFVREAKAVSKQMTEWRQFVNEDFLVSFQSWQTKVTNFVSTYETSFTFYESFLSSYKRFEEAARAKGMDPDSEEAKELRKKALINPFSSPTVLITEDWQKHIGKAIQMMDEWLLNESGWRKNQDLLKSVLFLTNHDKAPSQTQIAEMLNKRTTYIGIRDYDYLSIRNHLMAASADFPLERFYPEGSYERKQLAATSGDAKEILIKQLKYKIITHAVKMMDSWLTYEVRNRRGQVVVPDYRANAKTPEFERAQAADEAAKQLGIPKSDLIARSAQVRILGNQKLLIKVRDTLKLPVFLPTGFLGRQGFLLDLQRLNVDAKSVAHPKSLFKARTPGPIEYFFASMACGPKVTKTMSVNGHDLDYDQIRSRIVSQMEGDISVLATTDDEEQRINIEKKYKQKLFNETKALIARVGIKNIESPLINDDEGYRLDFLPPRIMSTPEDISMINSNRVPRKLYSDHKYGVCSGGINFDQVDVYHTEFRNGVNGRQYFGMPEMIEDNLMWDLVNKTVNDPFEQKDVMQFYDWWERNAELPMFMSFHRFNETYKGLISSKFIPALLSKKRYGKQHGRSRHSLPKTKFKYGFNRRDGIPEGIKESVLAELTYIMRIIENNTETIIKKGDEASKLPEKMKDWTAKRAETMKMFHNYLGQLARIKGSYFDKKEMLIKLSKQLKSQINTLAQASGGLTVNMEWKPEWAKDKYTVELANAVRENGIVSVPEKRTETHMINRYAIYRLIELEEELAGYGQMLTFMPNEYASVKAEATANLEAADF